MKNTINYLGAQFGKIPQKELNYGRKNIRKEISLRDLTSKQQEFQNKGTVEMVGRKLSKKEHGTKGNESSD